MEKKGVGTLQKNCSTLGFKALMVTQFLGAFNDNVYKLAVSLITVRLLVTHEGGAVYLSIGGALFVLPFLLFSSYAGYLADRFAKSSIIRFSRAMETAAMSLGWYFLVEKNMPGLFAVLFLMGLDSALLSPSKFGILPEILTHDQLSRGNGYIQFWTFLAIIIGTAVGGELIAVSGGNFFLVGLVVWLVAATSWFTGLFVTNTAAIGSSRPFEPNPFKDVFLTLREIRQTKPLFMALLAQAYFWFVGAFVQLNILLYARQMLNVGETGTSILLAALAVGVGWGSILAGKVSEGNVELGLIPLGAVGMCLFSLGLGLFHNYLMPSLLFTLGLGLSGGFYVVPLNAFIQHQSPEFTRGRYLGANNFLTFGAMLLASAALWLLRDVLALNAAQLFLVIGLSSIASAAYLVKSLPEALVRCVNWIMTHSLYRVRPIGKENIPERGGALLVANYHSFTDPSLILAAIERKVRFLMSRALYQKKLIRPLAKMMSAIPISVMDPPRTMDKALKQANQAVRDGWLVCIFLPPAAEGEPRLWREADPPAKRSFPPKIEADAPRILAQANKTEHARMEQMLSFKQLFEHIMKGLDAPIVPIHMDKSWGNVLDFQNNHYVWKMPPKIPSPVTIWFGTPLAAGASASKVAAAVRALQRTAHS